MRRLLPKLRQDLGDAVTDGGWDGTDRVGRRPGSLWTPPQLPPGISSCLKPQRVFIRRPHRPEAHLSALGSPAAVAWQEPNCTGLPAPGAGRPCSPEQWPLVDMPIRPQPDHLQGPGSPSTMVSGDTGLTQWRHGGRQPEDPWTKRQRGTEEQSTVPKVTQQGGQSLRKAWKA
ncbi:hypothetical protein EI555_003561 [Monodon monoceros]|uniref:Uncharacterized protein n=1 Tax=Monodon monoceros TaxID=40151 RepID=A0A4U1F6P3_MONMO|nr:hypothetical protein EI555_003561 [Monodon monoceros]